MAWEWFSPRYPERRRVVVNTTDDSGFSGVLWQQERGYLVLKGAELVRDRGRPVEGTSHIDGDVVIYRDRVAFLQVLG